MTKGTHERRRGRPGPAAAALSVLACCSGWAAPAIESPPGAAPFDDGLRSRLAEAVAARGDDYEPRTRHLNEDGSPRFANRLILETSPYLLQHAHNPVNWYPWGDEAFETARRLGRPVLLSVGYSTCHWCHVMEEESFEDLEIARFLNENYVAIKVDREERPDVDSIYMTAVQMITGRGGWPMTVWLTPDREPFHGGTYFPARDGDRGSGTGFLTLLRRVVETYSANQDQLAGRAERISKRIRQTLATSGGGKLPGRKVLDAAAAHYEAIFDPADGGRTGAPKFPSTFPVRFLLRQGRRADGASGTRMAALTLERMAGGGIRDQIGGGFHRYSTDARWLVPHFEMMLYDNALLAVAYVEGYQATGRARFAEVARGILDYVAREMTSPGGGFYSASDADSAGPDGHLEEGRFFTWTPGEVRAALDEESAAVAIARYGVSERGDLDGRSVLHLARSIEDVAREVEVPPERVRSILEKARGELYRARSKRPAPLRDDKILTSWNGLMISAFAIGGRVLDEAGYLRAAERAASFALERLRKDGRLLRSYKDGAARHDAYLDDYAFLGAGLLDLYEATSDARWLEQAIALQTALDRHYHDGEAGGYFLTSDDRERLLAREKPAYDGAEPTGNSVAVRNLLRLYELTSDPDYLARAERALKAFAPVLDRNPWALSEMLIALDFHLDRPREIVIVTEGPKERAKPFLRALDGRFVPNRVLVVAAVGEDLARQARLVPLLKDKVARDGKTTAYVCRGGACKLPTTDVAAFLDQVLAPDATSDAAAPGAADPE